MHLGKLGRSCIAVDCAFSCMCLTTCQLFLGVADSIPAVPELLYTDSTVFCRSANDCSVLDKRNKLAVFL